MKITIALLIQHFCLVLVIIGMMCNFLVMTNNEGKMPVKTIYAYESERHFSFQHDSEVEYPLLSDRFKLRNSIWSIGDFIMVAGISGYSYFGIIIWYEGYKFRKLEKSKRKNINRYENLTRGEDNGIV